MRTILLNIIGLTYSQSQSNAYALLMGEENGPRRLPIVIGAFEAQSIAIALEKKLLPPRPLTHDLFTSLALSYNIYLKEVMIHKLKKGIFYSYLLFEQDGELKKIDSRTSDAVALALRFNCPVYTYESILEKAGVILDDDNSSNESIESPIDVGANLIPRNDEDPKEENMTKLSDKAIQKKLEQAIESENYELAALLRDELQKRNSGL